MCHSRFKILLRLLLLLFLSFAGESLSETLVERQNEGIIAKVNFTIYYTPRESGFVEGKGFDLTPRTMPGLEGKKFASDFLKAVRMEGHGKLVNPHKGYSYIYYNGEWGYTDSPKGIRKEKLVPKQSCAISTSSSRLKTGMWIELNDDELPPELSGRKWKIVDVGSGVNHMQVDLYWGEDEPSGPYNGLYRPAGTTFSGCRGVQLSLVSSSPTGGYAHSF